MSVIGIDLGGAYSVIAQAQKGGIKTVLNGASQRRSSTLVSISGKERALAANADTMIKSNYKNTVWYINRLIGRKLGLPDTEKEFVLLTILLIQHDQQSQQVLTMCVCVFYIVRRDEKG